jgi:hypothetical protein
MGKTIRTCWNALGTTGKLLLTLFVFYLMCKLFKR